MPPKRRLNHRSDFTAHSAVIVCERPGCLWRCLAHTPASAWRLLADHCRRVHHDHEAAAYALRRSGQTRGVS